MGVAGVEEVDGVEGREDGRGGLVADVARFGGADGLRGASARTWMWSEIECN